MTGREYGRTHQDRLRRPHIETIHSFHQPSIISGSLWSFHQRIAALFSEPSLTIRAGVDVPRAGQ